MFTVRHSCTGNSIVRGRKNISLYTHLCPRTVRPQVVPPENCEVAQRNFYAILTNLRNCAIFATTRNFRATSFNLGYCYFGRTLCKPVATDANMATYDFDDTMYVIESDQQQQSHDLMTRVAVNDDHVNSTTNMIKFDRNTDAISAQFS